MTLTDVAWTPKETSHKQAVRYQSRVIHEVEPAQKELNTSLKALKETTDQIIDYFPIGRVGVTLSLLDSVMRQVLGTDKKGTVSEAARRDFENELNEEFPRLQGNTVEVEDPDQPLALYGNKLDRVGLQLSLNDERLFGGRVLMERYIRKEYPTLSERFGDEVVNWEPHVSIGRLKTENLDSFDLEAIRSNPSDFIMAFSHRVAEENTKQFCVENIAERIAFPEDITLGGLRVVCDKQPERVF